MLQKLYQDVLRSVVKQNFDNFEIVISDNNSVDDSFRICNSYKKKNTKE